MFSEWKYISFYHVSQAFILNSSKSKDECIQRYFISTPVLEQDRHFDSHYLCTSWIAQTEVCFVMARSFPTTWSNPDVQCVRKWRLRTSQNFYLLAEFSPLHLLNMTQHDLGRNLAMSWLKSKFIHFQVILMYNISMAKIWSFVLRGRCS